jgi:hypothetical protein
VQSTGLAQLAGGFTHPTNGSKMPVRSMTRRVTLVLPWILSLLTPRLEWTEHGPAVWNVLRLFPVVAGALGLAWV